MLTVLYHTCTCQLFLTQRHEFFILGVPGFGKITQVYQKSSDDAQRFPKSFQIILKFSRIMVMLHADHQKSEILGKVSSFTHLLSVSNKHGSEPFIYMYMAFCKVLTLPGNLYRTYTGYRRTL